MIFLILLFLLVLVLIGLAGWMVPTPKPDPSKVWHAEDYKRGHK